MAEKISVTELKDVVSFVCALANGADKALADGKVTLDDAFLMLAPIQKVIPAFVGIQKVPAELKDLDQAEADELREMVKAELDLTNDTTEVMVENILGAALKIGAVIAEATKPKEAPTA